MLALFTERILHNTTSPLWELMGDTTLHSQFQGSFCFSWESSELFLHACNLKFSCLIQLARNITKFMTHFVHWWVLLHDFCAFLLLLPSSCLRHALSILLSLISLSSSYPPTYQVLLSSFWSNFEWEWVNWSTIFAYHATLRTMHPMLKKHQKNFKELWCQRSTLESLQLWWRHP